MRARSVFASFAFTSIALMAAGVGLAQDDGFGGAAAPVTPVDIRPASQSPDYGTATRTGLVIGAANFSARSSSTTWTTANGSNRYMTNAGGALQFNPMVPNGAQIERIEIEACDTSATEQVSLTFGPCPTSSDNCSLAGIVATGGAATPGCSFFATNLAAPVVADNAAQYLLASIGTGTTSATTFSAVRLFYRLQVSPAPGAATFTDVPTGHPFFRFVEALASAGITGGCGSGLYCPDSPVTRGQMAVFLSVALGLHFPN